MKRILLAVLFGSLVLPLALLGRSARAATQAPPGSCYRMNVGSLTLIDPDAGLVKADCGTFKAIYPTLNLDPGKCYIADARNRINFAIPAETPCNNIPDKATDVIPVGTLPIVPTPQPKSFVPAECSGNITDEARRGACSRIPLGCPGTSLQGPASASFDPSTCPYAADPNAPKATPTPVSASPDITAFQESSRDAVITCDGSTPEKAAACLRTNPIVTGLEVLINILSGVAGVIIVIMVIIGGLQYMASGANPQAVESAKKRIINAMLALVMLVFLYSFLQWVVPGGVF